MGYPLTASIELSATMLDKSTINAVESLREILKESEICDYSSLGRGGENGVVHECTVHSGERSYPSSFKMYKPFSKDEKRFWVSGLSRYANAGDIMVISIDDAHQILVQIVQDQELLNMDEDESSGIEEVVTDSWKIPESSDDDDSSKLDHYQVSFSQLVQGDTIFIMPRFQREFSWKKPEFDTLWMDIDAVWFNEEPRQFLGPIVTRIDHSKKGTVAGRTWVIDGQQRMTTLYAINIAIAKLAQDNGFLGLASSCCGMLFVGQKVDDDHNRPTLWPTVKDTKQFNDLLRLVKASNPDMKLEPDFGTNTRLRGAYDNHLRKKVVERCRGPDGKISELKLKYLFSIVNDKLLFIQIDVPNSLSVHRVFDRLNTQGRKLSTADLVRNLIFEKLMDNPDEAAKLHDDRVLPMEERFQFQSGKKDVKSRLSDYYFPFALTLGDDSLTSGNMFQKLRHRWKDITADDVVTEVGTLVDEYLALHFGPNDVNPLTSSERLAEDHLLRSNKGITERVSRLHRLKIPSGTYPYLMPLLESLNDDDSKNNVSNIIKCLDIIESFQIRRNFSGIQSAGYQTLFRSLWSECEKKADPKKLVSLISDKSGYDYPDDEVFSQTISKAHLYKKKGLCRYVLNEYEISLGPPKHQEEIIEKYIDSTSEHIIPQDNALWKEEMKIWTFPDGIELDDWIQDNIDTWANLTILLGSENSELTNETWSKKRKGYQEKTVYRSPRELSKTKNWDNKAHDKRKDKLVKWALERWPYYG